MSEKHLQPTFSDLEILCICAGCTDTSYKIIQDYAQKDARIKCIDFDKTQRMAAAKNTGMLLAAGEYISFVNPTDFIDLNFYEILYPKAIAANADCILGKIQSIVDNKPAPEPNINRSQLQKHTFLFQHALAALYKKAFLISNALLFPTQVSSFENSVFAIMAAGHAQKIVTADSVSYYEDTPISDINLKTLKDLVVSLKLIIGFLDALPLDIVTYYEALKPRLNLLSLYANAGSEYKEFCQKAERNLLKSMKQEAEFLKYEKLLETQAFWNEKLKLNFDKALIDNEIKTAAFYGVRSEKQNPRLIVTLTSFPERMYDIHYCLYSLLTQSHKPDEIILWLGEEEFLHQENDLPITVLKLKESGLTIKFTKNIRSYKKLIPALREYPNEILVTADDDIYYPKNWLEKLWKAHTLYSEDIICHRAHLVQLSKNGNIAPYNRWQKEITASEPSYLQFCTTGAGVLYPPHALYQDVLDEEKFLQLSPFADDIWFWAMAV